MDSEEIRAAQQAAAEIQAAQQAHLELTQKFIEAESPWPMYEADEFEPLVGKSFSLTDIVDAEQGQLVLDEVEKLPENKTRRKSVRKQPFSLVFSRPDMDQVPSGYYKLRSDGVEDYKVLYIKQLDYSEVDELNLYEATVN